eukprot:2536883-Prymnesium_polylepis.1
MQAAQKALPRRGGHHVVQRRGIAQRARGRAGAWVEVCSGHHVGMETLVCEAPHSQDWSTEKEAPARGHSGRRPSPRLDIVDHHGMDSSTVVARALLPARRDRRCLRVPPPAADDRRVAHAGYRPK